MKKVLIPLVLTLGLVFIVMSIKQTISAGTEARVVVVLGGAPDFNIHGGQFYISVSAVTDTGQEFGTSCPIDTTQKEGANLKICKSLIKEVLLGSFGISVSESEILLF